MAGNGDHEGHQSMPSWHEWGNSQKLPGFEVGAPQPSDMVCVGQIIKCIRVGSARRIIKCIKVSSPTYGSDQGATVSVRHTRIHCVRLGAMDSPCIHVSMHLMQDQNQMVPVPREVGDG